MPAKLFNFEIEQGSSFRWDITVLDPDDPSQPFSLSGYTPTAMARVNYDDVAPVITFTCAVITPAEGLMRLSLTDEVTAALTPNTTLVYDVELTSVAGDVAKIYRGKIRILPEATK